MLAVSSSVHVTDVTSPHLTSELIIPPPTRISIHKMAPQWAEVFRLELIF